MQREDEDDPANSYDELTTALEQGNGDAVVSVGKMSSGRRDSYLDTEYGLHAVLRALEVADDKSVEILCSVIYGYITEGKTSVRTRRMRRAVRMDCVSSAMRALRSRLSPPMKNTRTIDVLAEFLTTIWVKDPKMYFKLRVGGLLSQLCSLIVDHRPISSSLLLIVSRALRSPRNAQLASKTKEFPRCVLNRALEAPRETMARHLEILYLLCKNKRSRVWMHNGGVVQVLVSLLDRLSSQLKEKDHPPYEATLLVIGLLKLFANSRKGKEEVMTAEMVAACERCLNSLSNHSDKTAMQVQDSLCSLCVRCVPAEKFPLAGRPFPLSFELPARRMKTGNQRASTSYQRANDARSSDEDVDQDEYEEFLEDLGEESDLGRSEEEEENEVPKKENGQPKGEIPPLSSYQKYFIERNGMEKVRKKAAINYSANFPLFAQKTRSVMNWAKIAFPEMAGPDRELPLQPLVFNTNSMRQVAAHATRRIGHRMHRVVYHLDDILGNPPSTASPNQTIGNEDRSRFGKVDPRFDHLLFESRFESGNLRSAIQIDRNHYELILQPDINQGRHHFQWFYFEISNCESNVEYTFEVINCVKTTSMFAHGMQPVAFSVGEAMAGRPGWVRVGHSICYYRNQYYNASEDDNGNRKERFFTLRFSVTLRHRGDICYLAYHFPYTLSFLHCTLECWLTRTPSSVFHRVDTIGQSLAGNPISLVTISAAGSRAEVQGRSTVIFTARVHPGESNASWIMHGILEHLLTSDDAEVRAARSRCVFKIIPMLNPDGVISGNHRCSLAGHDLNRVWDSPSKTIHPEIFHAKGVIYAAAESGPPLLFVDIHGHSRRSNVFLFGNNSDLSWLASDRLVPSSLDFLHLAELLETHSPAFSISHCRWSITRGKEGSARVALWRQLGFPRAYTMESTYCGFDSGPYKGYQIGISELKEVGRNLVQSTLELDAIVKGEQHSIS